nr:reverse transcriptase domain-containing protein [Tanacetum cinerariifolium]
MLLDFDDVQDVSDKEIEGDMKGKAKVGDEDLSKPFKEAACPRDKQDPLNPSIPKMINEMLKRVDDYLRSEEVFRNTELPNGEFQRKDPPVQWERHTPYVLPQHSNQEFCRPRENRVVLTLDSLSSTPQEILATEHQLRLPQPAPLVGTPSKENLDRREGKKQAVEWPEEVEPQEKVSPTEQALVNPAYSEQLVAIGKSLLPKGSMQLKKNKDIFTWEPADMTGVPKRIIKQSLNANPSVTLVSQKRRVFCSEKSKVITKEVAEWLKVGIVRPVRYPTWISNPVLVKKVDESWRMCIDFKNVNFACPKDYYPMLEIDSKIESVVGFPLKCFVDAYKGYHQVHMAEEDEEKTAFYTDQGTFCYTKMPFGLKNAGATYQQLVDEAFQSQIRRNLEVYVDDMVVKRKSEREMLADIAKTFDNLRRINMKLKSKIVLVWGRRRKVLRIHGKLAALSRFLSRSAEKLLPFVETLKDITKENKHDYRWTEKAKRFPRAKEDSPGPTSPNNSPAKRNPVRIPSGIKRSKRIYAPLEKMKLALRHGYHQVHMAEEDEEKTAFYTDQGTFCYTKMPFGLKNAGATYQQLVDEAFQSQIRRNLEVYVDDMVNSLANDQTKRWHDVPRSEGGDIDDGRHR